MIRRMEPIDLYSESYFSVLGLQPFTFHSSIDTLMYAPYSLEKRPDGRCATTIWNLLSVQSGSVKKGDTMEEMQRSLVVLTSIVFPTIIYVLELNEQEELDMLAVKVLPKGQITLPKEVRQKLHIQVGDTLLMDTDGEQAVIRRGKTIFDFKSVLPSMGMTIDEIREKGIAGGMGADE